MTMAAILSWAHIPCTLDETCFFIAADFDKATWQEDTRAFLETCRTLKLPVALERSRCWAMAGTFGYFSVNLFQQRWRNWDDIFLTLTMERRPDIGLDSYDRFFPNQDTLPRGGFGNLIALPLQKRPRDLGNSVFLDDRLVSFSDQWAFLSSVRRMSRDEIEEIVRRAEAKGHVVGVRFAPDDEEQNDAVPWSAPPSRRRVETAITGPLPSQLELVLGNEIYVAKDTLPPAFRNKLIRLAAFQNPEFYKVQAMRLPTYNKPRIIACARLSEAYRFAARLLG